MLLEDMRDDIAKEFADTVMNFMGFVTDPSNAWVIDLATGSFLHMADGRPIVESFTQYRKPKGFTCKNPREFDVEVFIDPTYLDKEINYVNRYWNRITKKVPEDPTVHYMYPSTAVLFDPYNNITLMNYLFGFSINEYYGPDYVIEYANLSVPGSNKTSTRVLTVDGRKIDSQPRFNDSIKLLEVLGIMIEEPLDSAYFASIDREPIKKPKKGRK